MTTDDVLREYFHCLDTEDWARMRELWHPDGEMRAVGARPRAGVEEVLEFLAKIFVPWKAHEDRPTRIMTAGETATVEVTFIGTTHDGRDARFDAVDVFDFEDGVIRRLSNWYDVAYARRLLTQESEVR